MADRCHAHGVTAVPELIHDSVRSNAKRAQSSQPAAQLMTNLWVAFEQRERVLDSVDQRPTQLEEILSGTPRQDDAGHGSAGFAHLVEVVS